MLNTILPRFSRKILLQYAVLSLITLYALPGFAVSPLYTGCSADIPKPEMPVDRHSPEAVATAFMQAVAHNDTETAVSLVNLDLLEQGAEAGRLYTEDWIKEFIGLVDREIGGIDSIILGEKTTRSEVFLPGVVGVELPYADFPVILTFCLKSELPQGYEVRPAKIPLYLTLISWEGEWSVVDLYKNPPK